MKNVLYSPVDSYERLANHLNIQLLVKRDDLLAFPLAGNKVRKILAELDGIVDSPDALVTNGAISSNHCRTLAMIGARRGIDVHLVLHGERDLKANSLVALKMLTELGAQFTIVQPSEIEAAITKAVNEFSLAGRVVHVIAGGCHTPLGAMAYYHAASVTLAEHRPSYVVLASGTGATQGGVAAAAAALGGRSHVVGVSVARSATRGRAAVLDAARWAGAGADLAIDFRDSNIDGGYGCHGPATDEAVRLGWRYGLPLDSTYTGKAFAGLLDMVHSGEIESGTKVLFWHTGGLANYLADGDS